MRKVAIIGSTGMLGHATAEFFRRQGDLVLAIDRSKFDIAKDPIDRLETLLSDQDVVINCAGIIKPMIAQNSIEDVLKINSVFPKNLVKIADRHGFFLFHISTDCVFDGLEGQYTESHKLSAADVYGLSKAAGEVTGCMVLRTSIIGEEFGHSRSLLSWAKSQKGKQVNGFTNHIWNGVTTIYLAEIIDTILATNSYKKGIFHVHSPERVNKQQLVTLLSEVYDLDLEVVATTTEIPCDRSLQSEHDLSRQVAVKSLARQVQEMYQFFNIRQKAAVSSAELSL